ncbi:hypothetical protein C8R45DRAFT_167403 [Mycena sanguinolenta]|nr:hypothetical protein C8R45DRAFT_167403 [Mycena sanguinolenta]
MFRRHSAAAKRLLCTHSLSLMICQCGFHIRVVTSSAATICIEFSRFRTIERCSKFPWLAQQYHCQTVTRPRILNLLGQFELTFRTPSLQLDTLSSLFPVQNHYEYFRDSVISSQNWLRPLHLFNMVRNPLMNAPCLSFNKRTRTGTSYGTTLAVLISRLERAEYIEDILTGLVNNIYLHMSRM